MGTFGRQTLRTTGEPATGALAELPRSLSVELRKAEAAALRGDPDRALALLAGIQSALPGWAAGQQLAVAEQAMLVERLGGGWRDAQRICDRALEAVEDAAARGHLLLYRGRVSRGTERRRCYTSALTEFAIAGDDGGKALALGWLAFPHNDDRDISLEYRARLGHDGLRLARELGDPYVMAVCASNLAACETFLGRPTALSLWRQATDVPPSRIDGRISPVVSLAYVNWALTATALGDYTLASRVVHEGEAMARGRRWERTLASVEAVIEMRRGHLSAAVRAAERARLGKHDRAGCVGEVVALSCAYQYQSRPDVSGLDAAVTGLIGESEQLEALARAVQARIRAARREPEPCRSLPAAIEGARQRGRRFGWEDLLMAYAEIRPRGAREEMDRLGGLWPAGPRAEAAHHYVEGLLTGDHTRLEEAARLFEALPEPITAGQALHRAARLNPDVTAGNRLLLRAVDLYRSAGAERSLAAVLREGRLRRSPSLPSIPSSQRHAVHMGLTPREHQVARLAQRGLTGREIAEQLCIAEGTVRNHLLRIRQKLGGVRKHQLSEMFAPGDGNGS